MKKYTILKALLLLITISVTISCSKEFINEEAPYSIDSENYFNSESEYNKALIGAYDMLQSSYINVMLGEIASDKPNPFKVPDDFRKSKKSNSRARFKAEPWVPFKPEQVVFLLQIAMSKEDTPLANLIVIAAYTGARIEEICSLQRKHIDLVNHSISIIGAKTAAGNRTIPIHSAIQPLVEKLMEQSTDDYLISKLTKNKYGDRSNAIGKRFGRLKTAEGYDSHHVFHSIRKTFVTMLENAGKNFDMNQ